MKKKNFINKKFVIESQLKKTFSQRGNFLILYNVSFFRKEDDRTIDLNPSERLCEIPQRVVNLQSMTIVRSVVLVGPSPIKMSSQKESFARRHTRDLSPSRRPSLRWSRRSSRKNCSDRYEREIAWLQQLVGQSRAGFLTSDNVSWMKANVNKKLFHNFYTTLFYETNKFVEP
jgi:hypothetical protein